LEMGNRPPAHLKVGRGGGRLRDSHIARNIVEGGPKDWGVSSDAKKKDSKSHLARNHACCTFPGEGYTADRDYKRAVAYGLKRNQRPGGTLLNEQRGCRRHKGGLSGATADQKNQPMGEPPRDDNYNPLR